jgi:peptidoglycan/LPS O-acetylase OafA/YrhL
MSTPSALPRAHRHLPALDGIRGLAIALVLLCHFAPAGDETLRWHGVGLGHAIGNALCRVSRSGWCGVDLFFVLSGFLITGILADARESAGYFRNFYIRRGLRVLPLYYGVLLVCLVILPHFFAATDPGAREVIEHPLPLWTHTANLAIAAHGKWYLGGGMLGMNQFWSLAIEEQFYLVWPIVVLLLPRQRVMQACIGVFLLSLTTRLGLALRGATDVTIYTFTLCRLDGLAAGGWLALALRGPAEMKSLVRPAWLIAAASGVGLILLARASGTWSLDRSGIVGQTLLYSFLALFFAASMVLVLAGPAMLGRIFSHPLARFLGRYSYGLYIFNSLLDPIFDVWFPARLINRVVHWYALAAGLHILLSVVGTVAVAMLSYHLFEKHFLRLKDVFAGDRATMPRKVLAGSASDGGPVRHATQLGGRPTVACASG